MPKVATPTSSWCHAPTHHWLLWPAPPRPRASITAMAGRARARHDSTPRAWSIGAFSLGRRRVRAIVPNHESITRATGPRIMIDVAENRVCGTSELPASSLPHPAKARVPAAAIANITVLRLNRAVRANTGTISLTTPKAGNTVAHMAG